MRTYSKPETILKHGQADIEAGLWCKGHLVEYGKDGACPIDEDALYEEYLVDAEDEGRKPKMYDKPIGCALGLVSMYAGLGEELEIFTEDGKKQKVFLPRYPYFKDGEGVKKALLALYEAIPSPYFTPEDMDDRDREDMIIESIHKYNDSDNMGIKKASKWFGKALASL